MDRERRTARGHWLSIATGIAVGVVLSLTLGFSASAQPQPQISSVDQKEAIVTARASGKFDVKLTPQDPTGFEQTESAQLGRMSIDKHYHGDLEASGKGVMLSARTEVEGSAGYVAIEQVSGTLHGRSGTFVLQHSGIMTHGAPQLTITVVPDSGTRDLAGLAGRMAIHIQGKEHLYEFDYTLPE